MMQEAFDFAAVTAMRAHCQWAMSQTGKEFSIY